MPKPTNRGRTRRIGLVTAAIVVLVLAGIAGSLYAFGGKDIFRRVFAGDTAQKQNDEHAGKVAVLVSPTPIQAFSALDPTAMIDAKSGDFHVSWVTQKACDDAGLVRDPASVRGRVLKRDKGAWQAFSEADFFPKGTLASATAAIGAGERGVSLTLADLPGLRSLKRGDTFDLVAVLAKNAGAQPGSGSQSTALERAAESAHSFDTFRQTIAQNARIIQPVPDAAARALTHAPEEAFVAMKDEEFIALTAAIAKGAKIQLAARSGLPGGDPGKLEEPSSTPEPSSITIISGNTSTRTLVPADTQSASAKDGAAKEPK